MRFISSVAAMAACVCVMFSQPAQAMDAKAYVDGVAKQVLAVVGSDASTLDKQHKIESIFSDKVDIEFIAKFVLAKHWRTASAPQQQAYLGAYKPFILKNYASKLAKYSGQTYDIKNARADGDVSVVTMIVHDTDGKDIQIDYRLQGEKIVDIVVENVSLLTTQRSEFNSVVESKGLDYLIDRLKQSAAAKG